ncbi:MAG: hypothetical protein KIS29_10490 [Thermoplasmata archaeon]|nr:hypothetical protein [Candidatus Sysuiplasma jiujiangense]
MNITLLELRLFVVCDRCGTLEILSTIEEDRELAVEIKWSHMKNYPTHRVEAITSEVEI